MFAQEMGDVGDEGDVVDEQLWGQDEDKPQQSKAEEKYEKDAPVQVIAQHILAWMHLAQGLGQRRQGCIKNEDKASQQWGFSECSAAHCDSEQDKAS